MKNIKLKISLLISTLAQLQFSILFAFKPKIEMFDKIFLISVFPIMFIFVYVSLIKFESNFKNKNGIKKDNSSTL